MSHSAVALKELQIPAERSGTFRENAGAQAEMSLFRPRKLSVTRGRGKFRGMAGAAVWKRKRGADGWGAELRAAISAPLRISVRFSELIGAPEFGFGKGAELGWH